MDIWDDKIHEDLARYRNFDKDVKIAAIQAQINLEIVRRLDMILTVLDRFQANYR